MKPSFSAETGSRGTAARASASPFEKGGSRGIFFAFSRDLKHLRTFLLAPLAFVTSLLILTSHPARAVTETLGVQNDTWVWSALPDDNFGQAHNRRRWPDPVADQTEIE
jgi:hypothetical protein